MQESHVWTSAGIGFRRFSTIGEVDIREKVEDINTKFAEAREEIDLAMEAKDTVFFNEEALGAKKLVEEVLEEFKSLLDQVDERRRGELQRSMGMKMEQLKAEAAQLDEASS
ncbi:hypothetical protein KFL_000130090 [Klebsormidium nitens]|uniref:Uncharacterized protein n=1 Tax=Klebsormidium nitens TaxID=105231 RepID=A0A1Y1HPC2_KLENI|nr:hypothetical protein KFL_000130090 [Klebsormidium nitens]|eukprot:GAQ78427.1 hypothetical protein KFL_000130090 [Klebsormidium nitens]